MMRSEPMPTNRAQIVLVDGGRNFTSTAFTAVDLGGLQAAFRAVPWYRDRWTNKNFRAEVLRFIQQTASGGVVLIGPRIKFPIPPPFDELIEPIQLNGGLGAEDDQLRVLSGSQPTRQERGKRIALFILAPFFLLGIGAIIYGWIRGIGIQIAAVVAMIVGSAGFGLSIAKVAERLGGRWFLVPGAVAIVKNRGRPENRLVLRTARDTAAIVRYVHAGKTVILMIELWCAEGKRWRRGVTEREAMSFLAAWQSVHPPPTMEQLRELVT